MSAGDRYYYYPSSTHNGTYWDTVFLNELQDMKSLICKNKLYDAEQGEPMKALYNVIVVTKAEKIILDEKVVAENEDEAKFNADVSDVLKKNHIKPKDVTVICRSLGQVKVEDEIKKVQIVREKEEYVAG